MLGSRLAFVSILLRLTVAYESFLMSKLNLLPANASQFNSEDMSLSPNNNFNKIQVSTKILYFYETQSLAKRCD